MTDIKVNKGQWDQVPEADKKRITEGLRQAGTLRYDEVIVGDPNAVQFTENTMLAPMGNPIKDLCKAGCDVVAGVGVAWCVANTVGVGLAVCLAAAEVAREECKKRC